jgi:hypothetical protein
MKTVKTARGRIMDMSALAAKNEKTRAVSNLNMNARGDIIDNRGNVEIPREEIQKEFYKKNAPSEKETISIKAEETKTEKKTVVEEPTPTAKKEPTTPKVTEVGRTARTRDDGTQYFEVEYSDGSMQDIDS